MSHKTQNIVLVTAILLVAVGLPFWLIMIPVAPYQPDPKPIIVDASRLPTTVNVDGARITLDRVEKYDLINVYFLVQGQLNNRQVDMKQVQALDNGKTLDYQGKSYGSVPGNPSTMDLGYLFSTRKGIGKLDISCVIQSNMFGKTVKLPFRNISPSSLPITRKAGPVSITLERAYYGKPQNFFGDRDKYLIITGNQTGPVDNFKQRFTISKHGQDLHNESFDPYWFVEIDKLKDESGKQLRNSAFSNIEIGGPKTIFEKEIGHLTTMESFMAKVNSPKASTMITNRAIRAAMKSTNRTFRFEYHFEADHLPKHFTWEPIVNVQLTDRKQSKIIFRNVPIPP
jgi:hypothetical protein